MTKGSTIDASQCRPWVWGLWIFNPQKRSKTNTSTLGVQLSKWCLRIHSTKGQNCTIKISETPRATWYKSDTEPAPTRRGSMNTWETTTISAKGRLKCQMDFEPQENLAPRDRGTCLRLQTKKSLNLRRLWKSMLEAFRMMKNPGCLLSNSARRMKGSGSMPLERRQIVVDLLRSFQLRKKTP